MHNIFTKIFKRDVWPFGTWRLFEFLHLIGKGFQQQFNYLMQFTFIFCLQEQKGDGREITPSFPLMLVLPIVTWMQCSKAPEAACALWPHTNITFGCFIKNSVGSFWLSAAYWFLVLALLQHTFTYKLLNYITREDCLLCSTAFYSQTNPVLPPNALTGKGSMVGYLYSKSGVISGSDVRLSDISQWGQCL